MEDQELDDTELLNDLMTDEPETEANAPDVEQETIAEDVEGEGEETQTEVEATSEPDQSEGEETEANDESEAEPDDSDKTKQDANIPAWRLGEVTQERNLYKKQLEDQGRDIAQMRAQLQQHQQVTQQEQANQNAPDWFENPDAAMQHALQAQLAPLTQSLQQTNLAQSRTIANLQYGKDTVEQAEQAFMTAVNSGAVDASEVQKVADSPNRYETAVEWHKRTTALEQVGGDIDAYNKTMREQLLDDPDFLKQVGERLQGQSTNGGAKPVTKLPPSLNKAASSAPATASREADMDDGEIFNDIMSG